MVGSFRNPSNSTAALAARGISFDLVSRTVEDEIVTFLYGCGPLHGHEYESVEQPTRRAASYSERTVVI